MMKVLAVSDQEVERIYPLAVSGHFEDVDILLGCGDLPYTYLEYLVTALNVPLYYVPGNHDPTFNPDFLNSYAEGGVNLDLRAGYENGRLIAGLGGSIRYRPDGVNQYTQAQFTMRALLLLLRISVKKKRYGRGLDILISHSPPYGIHDETTQAHTGLKGLNLLIKYARPRYLFHGHTHFFRHNLADAITQMDSTTVMNIYPYKVIEIPEEG
jgi:Icc-related predicted phosphoesterase